MTTNRCPHEDEHTVDLSPTAHLLEELQLFGHRPLEDEPDSREIAAWERQATPQAHASTGCSQPRKLAPKWPRLTEPVTVPKPLPCALACLLFAFREAGDEILRLSS